MIKTRELTCCDAFFFFKNNSLSLIFFHLRAFKRFDRSLSEDFCIIIIEMHVIIIHLLGLYCSSYYEAFVCFNGSGGCREMSILFQSEPADSATNLLNHNSIRTVYNIRLYENITYGDFFPSDNRPSYRSPRCDMRSNGVRRCRTDSTTTWRSACVLRAGWSVPTSHTHRYTI